jgi:hypothetical protein
MQRGGRALMDSPQTFVDHHRCPGTVPADRLAFADLVDHMLVTSFDDQAGVPAQRDGFNRSEMHSSGTEKNKKEGSDDA